MIILFHALAFDNGKWLDYGMYTAECQVKWGDDWQVIPFYLGKMPKLFS